MSRIWFCHANERRGFWDGFWIPKQDRTSLGQHAKSVATAVASTATDVVCFDPIGPDVRARNQPNEVSLQCLEDPNSSDRSCLTATCANCSAYVPAAPGGMLPYAPQTAGHGAKVVCSANDPAAVAIRTTSSDGRRIVKSGNGCAGGHEERQTTWNLKVLLENESCL